MLCHLSYRFPRMNSSFKCTSEGLFYGHRDKRVGGGGAFMSSAPWSWKVTPSLRGEDTQQGSVKNPTQMSQSLLESTALSLSLIHIAINVVHVHNMTSSSEVIIGQKQHNEKIHNKQHLSQLLLNQLLYAVMRLLILSAYIMGINLHFDLSEKN